MPFARSSARADSEGSIASGVSAYLTKPIDTRELEAAIKLAAARHAEFEALEAEVSKAQQALEDRKLVERAKGLLMSALKLSEKGHCGGSAGCRRPRGRGWEKLTIPDAPSAAQECRELRAYLATWTGKAYATAGTFWHRRRAPRTAAGPRSVEPHPTHRAAFARVGSKARLPGRR